MSWDPHGGCRWMQVLDLRGVCYHFTILDKPLRDILCVQYVIMITLSIYTYVYYIHIMWQHPSLFACAGGFSDLTSSSASHCWNHQVDQFHSEKRESEPGAARQPSMVRPSLALQPNSGTKRCLDHSDMKIEGWRAFFLQIDVVEARKTAVIMW